MSQWIVYVRECGSLSRFFGQERGRKIIDSLYLNCGEDDKYKPVKIVDPKKQVDISDYVGTGTDAKGALIICHPDLNVLEVLNRTVSLCIQAFLPLPKID
jgi:hypothetical protein